MSRKALSALLCACLAFPEIAAPVSAGPVRPVRLIVQPGFGTSLAPYAPVRRRVDLGALRPAPGSALSLSVPKTRALLTGPRDDGKASVIGSLIDNAPESLKLAGAKDLSAAKAGADDGFFQAAFGAAGNGLIIGRLDNGAEVYELRTGPLKTKVYLDAETQAFVRGLPPGVPAGFFGSQSLDMLRPDGEIARTGHMNPAGDVDLFSSGSHDELRNKAAAAYRNEVQLLYSVNAMFLLGNNFSIAKLSLSFTHAGGGKIVARWQGPLFGEAERLQAYEDLLAGRIRYTEAGVGAPPIGINDATAVQGLVYLTRYPGMHWEEETRRLIAVALGTERLSGIARKRMKKVFQRALDPGSVMDILKELDVYRGAVRRAARRALLGSGRLAEALASPDISEETRKELRKLQASAKP